MTNGRLIVQRRIMIGALVFAIASLPFSIKVCHAAIIVLILNWTWEGSWYLKLQAIRGSILLQITIALFLTQLAGLALADNLTRGWFSVEKKIFFVLLPIVMATTVIRLTRQEVAALLTVFVVVCFSGALVCVFSAWHATASGHGPFGVASIFSPANGVLPEGMSPDWDKFSYLRLAGGIGIHPTYFALYLATCIVMILHSLASMKTPFTRGSGIALVAFFTIFIMLLSSRIVIISLAAMYFFLLMRSLSYRRGSHSFLAAGGTLVLIVMLFLNPVARIRNLEAIKALTSPVEPNKHYTTAAQIRSSLWWLAAISLKSSDHLTGSGTGDVQKVMASRSARYHITNVIHSYDPHSQYLYTWIANGLPALIILLIFLCLPAWWAWEKRDPVVFGFVFLFALVCTTESALELQKGIAFYALISGLLFYQKQSFHMIPINLRSVIRAE